MSHSNKLNFKYAIMLVFVIAVTLVSQSCKRAAEKTSEKMIENAIGDDANVEIDDEKVVIETLEGTFTADAKANSWPNEIPSDLPKFKDGKIMGVTTQDMDDNKNWVVIFEDVPQTALQKYREELENNGFKINYTTTAGTGGHLSAEKGKLAVVVMVGEGNATVTVGSNQQ